MKNLNKKIGAVALSGVVVLGGFAASGINIHAYSPSLSKQIQDLGREGGPVYYDAKRVVEKSGAKIEAVFSSSQKMSRYLESNYWDRIQRHSSLSKKERKN